MPQTPVVILTALTSSAILLFALRKRKIRQGAVSPCGFIFDLDGTLIDFEGAAHDALNAPLERFGKEVSWKLHGSISGKPAKAWSKEILDALQVTEITAEQYAHEWHLETEKAFPTMKLMPGALDLIRRCKTTYPHAKLAVATSSERHNFDNKMVFHPELLASFDAIVTGDEIGRGKPNPDIFLEAARRIGVLPRSCVVFEDSASGALGAQRAEMVVVAIPDDRMMNGTAAFSFANFVLKSLEEVDAELLEKIHMMIHAK